MSSEAELEGLRATAQAVEESFQKLMAGRGPHGYDTAPSEIKALFWEHWNNVEELNKVWTARVRLSLLDSLQSTRAALERAEGERDEARRVINEVHKIIDSGDEYGTQSIYGAFLKALKILETHRAASLSSGVAPGESNG